MQFQIFVQPPTINARFNYNHSSLTESILTLRSGNEIWTPPSFEAKESGLLYVERDDTGLNPSWKSGDVVDVSLSFIRSGSHLTLNDLKFEIGDINPVLWP